MKRLLILIPFLVFSGVAASEEINGEVDVSWVDPYGRALPAFAGSFRPDFANWRGLSLGIGLGLHISSRFKYETTDADTITEENAPNISDTTKWDEWYFFNENFLEIVNLELFLEGRWRVIGDENTQWKGWITAQGGLIIHSAVVTNYQTQFLPDQNSEIVDLERYVRTYDTQYRSEPYVSPGLLVGVGNFIFGYRHWVYFKEEDIQSGEPPRMVGTIRAGYRFTW